MHSCLLLLVFYSQPNQTYLFLSKKNDNQCKSNAKQGKRNERAKSKPIKQNFKRKMHILTTLFFFLGLFSEPYWKHSYIDLAHRQDFTTRLIDPQLAQQSLLSLFTCLGSGTGPMGRKGCGWGGGLVPFNQFLYQSNMTFVIKIYQKVKHKEPGNSKSRESDWNMPNQFDFFSPSVYEYTLHTWLPWSPHLYAVVNAVNEPGKHATVEGFAQGITGIAWLEQKNNKKSQRPWCYP